MYAFKDVDGTLRDPDGETITVIPCGQDSFTLARALVMAASKLRDSRSEKITLIDVLGQFTGLGLSDAKIAIEFAQSWELPVNCEETTKFLLCRQGLAETEDEKEARAALNT